MAFFEDLGKKIADAGQTTIQKTKNLADVAKLNSQISDEERRINNTYEQIGRHYMDVYGQCPEESFREFIDSIKESQGKIVEYKNSINEIKGVKKCPKCGAEIDNKSVFCSVCGAEIPKEEAAPAEGSTSDVKNCTGCGATVPAGCKFCTSCGKPF